MRHDSHYVEELARANRTVGRIIAVSKIIPNPDQPRSEIGDLTELSASIKSKGVLEPLLVKPRDNDTYMIIAGERRWRASKLAGLEEVPCIELDIDEQGIAEIALVENMQRKDLTIWEIADGLSALVENFGYTHDEIAEKIGKSRSTVTESISIAGLPKDVRARCEQSEIAAKSVLIEITRQFDEASMHKLLDEIQGGDLKRTEIREKVRRDQPEAKKLKEKAAKEIASGDEQAEVHPEIQETEEESSRTFTFSAGDDRFDLRIDFRELENFTKKDILIALKEVFDAVKREASAE